MESLVISMKEVFKRGGDKYSANRFVIMALLGQSNVTEWLGLSHSGCDPIQPHSSDLLPDVKQCSSFCVMSLYASNFLNYG